MKTIIFNKDTSWKYDSSDQDCNFYFLKGALRTLEHSFEVYGYLYLSRVYERLFIKWNPNNENVVFKKDDGPIRFEFDHNEITNEYIVTIAQ